MTHEELNKMIPHLCDECGEAAFMAIDGALVQNPLLLAVIVDRFATSANNDEKSALALCIARQGRYAPTEAWLMEHEGWTAQDFSDLEKRNAFRWNAQQVQNFLAEAAK